MQYKDKKNKKNYKQWKSDLLAEVKKPRGSGRRAYATRRYRDFSSGSTGGGGGGGGGLPPVGGEEG